MQRYRKKSIMSQDWRNILQRPHVYRVGSNVFRIQNQFIIIFIILLFISIIFYIFPIITSTICLPNNIQLHLDSNYIYNKTYPLSQPVKTSLGLMFKIGIVSDLDLESKVINKNSKSWVSLFKKGNLFWLPQNNYINIKFDDNTVKLSTTLSMKDRGMELSELITFDGRILSFDDRTGIVFQLENDEMYPWTILMDGNGKNPKGFKSEWATVKDNFLYVGSMGKEWTTPSGEFVDINPMWIKVISPRGDITSINWFDNYAKLRSACGIEFPGYMIHESGVWSDIHNHWFFLPRRCSKERFNETEDETMSCNVLLQADETFNQINVIKIGEIFPIRGFSSFKFLPGSNDDIIIALKTEEFQGRTATYITAFTIRGQVLLPDTKIAENKFEGLEFI